MVKKSQGEVRLSVVDNQYEDSVIRLVAEAYQHDVSIDNVTSLAQLAEDIDEVVTVDDDVSGVYCSCLFVMVIVFHVNK